VDFGIKHAFVDNDPPSVLTWQISVADIDVAIAVCESCGLDYVLDVQRPRPDWMYRRLLLSSLSSRPESHSRGQQSPDSLCILMPPIGVSVSAELQSRG
jgi:hypothetical protein